jgi:hypothetical protein
MECHKTLNRAHLGSFPNDDVSCVTNLSPAPNLADEHFDQFIPQD